MLTGCLASGITDLMGTCTSRKSEPACATKLSLSANLNKAADEQTAALGNLELLRC
jgi:hypothetical protein